MKKLIYLTSFYVEKGTKNCVCKKVGLINYLYTFRSVSYPSCKPASSLRKLYAPQTLYSIKKIKVQVQHVKEGRLTWVENDPMSQSPETQTWTLKPNHFMIIEIIIKALSYSC